MQDLGDLGGNYSAATGINDQGQVVGGSETSGSIVHYHAFLWQPDQGMSDLGNFPGRDLSEARGINDAGQVVGYSGYGPMGCEKGTAFLWQSGRGMTDLGTLPGDYLSLARGINDAGQVVGESYAKCYSGHAFLWQSGSGMMDLGTLPGYEHSDAIGINNAGQVVGDSFTSYGDGHAFLWQSGHGMTDLNDRLPAGSGWTLETATAINNHGQIVGIGLHNGQYRAFLLDLRDIIVDSVRTTDSRNVIVCYDITTDALAGRTFDIGIFHSRTPTLDRQDNSRIDSIRISGMYAEQGHHTVSEELPDGIAPEFSPNTGQLYHYVDAVADPDRMLTGVTIDNSRAYFHQYVIGAVSVGYKPHIPFDVYPAGWVKAMAKSLTADGYDAAIPFNRWGSGVKDPTKMAQAGQDLAGLVKAQVGTLTNLQDNDVIDIHLIGHSRGSVVVGEAMTNLLADPSLPPQLLAGFMKLTLLDPHPANRAYEPNADYDPGDIGARLMAKNQAFQDAVHDPAVPVPFRADEVEIFWQQTPASVFGLLDPEHYINLWG